MILTRYLAARRYATALLFVAICISAGQAQQSSTPRFEVTLPAGHTQPVTGRVFVVVARSDNPEPRLQAGSWRGRAEFMGVDVQQLQPGQSVSLTSSTLGYPLKNVRELPAGDYYVQALINVYTRFERSDGHVIWAHMDQWEGQQFNRSPGNLYSPVQRVHLDPLSGYLVRLSLTETIPPVQVPTDTQDVTHIKIQSALLTKFWGQPIYLGATVLLPEGYDAHANAHYPVLYEQGHFGLQPPMRFNPAPPAGNAPARAPGYDLYNQWSSPGFPRVIAVTFQHPT